MSKIFARFGTILMNKNVEIAFWVGIQNVEIMNSTKIKNNSDQSNALVSGAGNSCLK